MDYLLALPIFLVVCYFVWKWCNGGKKEATAKPTPYKVVKPPPSMISERKRVCAVVGGTGFIGGHLVDELVQRKNHYVFVLGRKIRPEKINPDVDCLIQVDMMDLDGLTSALKGVDSVINTAVIVPTVFDSGKDVLAKNRLVFGNLLAAAKTAGVKNLIQLCGFPASKPADPVFSSLVDSFSYMKKDALAANGKDGLQTCVIGPLNVIGINKPFMDNMVSGEMKSTMLIDNMPCSFMPVSYFAKTLVNAEEKLATPASAESVAGKYFPLRGEPMSWKTLFTLPGWPHKITNVSPVFMRILARINVICASLFSWAPLGTGMTPGMIDIAEFCGGRHTRGGDSRGVQSSRGWAPSPTDG